MSEIKTTVFSQKRNETLESVFTDDEANVILRKMSDDGNNFATSLLQSLNKYGLSSEQDFWRHKLAMDFLAKENKQPDMKCPNIREMFDNFPQTKKNPKITVRADFGDIVISRAGQRSKNPGFVYINNNVPFNSGAERLLYAVLNNNGEMFFTKNMTPEIKQFVTAFEENPVEVAANYGRETGCCMFCNRALTDAKSVEVGYGPICAKHFMLPYPGQEVIDEDYLSKVLEIAKQRGLV